MTLADLESLTAELVDARRAELTQVLRVVGAHKDTPLESTAAVMAIPVIYAHWEGFVKELLTLYLEHIEKQTIEPPNLQPHLFSFSKRSKIKTLSDSGSVERQAEFATWMIEQLSKPVLFENKKVDTHSNLSYENLKLLCDTLFLNISSIATSRRHINALVHKRNNIAHTGRPIQLDEGSVENDKELVMRLIESFAAVVIENAKNQSFRLAA